ncbi:hypothetical protein SAMN02910358_01116 [Lachnospiraceae bacterium XBB1006]|nr:hypothetical protein SAMN02910358_01116 [Lachnospiraceae bacterium XBB1006]
MIKYLRRLNEALPMLIATILVYGILVEVVGVWWVEDKLRYTTGLLIGIGLALFLSINIASSIWGMMDVSGKKGQAMVAVKAVLRYFVVVVVSMTMGYFHLGNIATWFIGVMGLKVAAFLQPLIHKVFFGKTIQESET